MEGRDDSRGGGGATPSVGTGSTQMLYGDVPN